MKHIVKSVIKTTLCLILMGTVSVTYAWFSNTWSSENNKLPFKTGKIEYPEMKMWTYLMKEEGSESGEWEEKTVEQEKNSAIKLIPGINRNESAGSFSYDLKSLQLGTIDNVLTLKKDNEMYLRIKVDTKRFKNTFELNIEPLNVFEIGEKNYSFELYDGNSNDGLYNLIDGDSEYNVTTQDGNITITGSEIYENVETIIETDESMLDYYYFVSNEELTPDELKIEDFIEITGGHIEAEYEGTEEYYYVYLLINPNLSLFIDLSKILTPYMPCVILNNVKISVSFKNTNTK